MRLSLIAIAAAAVAFASPALAQPWQTYRSPDLGFTVETPGATEIKQMDIPTPVGPVKTTIGVVDMGDRGVVLFSVGDYGPLVEGRAFDNDAALEGAAKGGVTNINGVIDSETTITVDGEPGREVVAHNDTLVMRSRVTLHHNKIYGLVGMGSKAVGAPPEFDRFETSFHFTD
jgi:hypothetical protein